MRNFKVVATDSPSLSRTELEAALKFSKDLNVDHQSEKSEEFLDEKYIRNDYDRCYYCKMELFDITGSIAEKPTSPCLSSRIMTGISITEKRLNDIETMEAILRKAGVIIFRIRLCQENTAHDEHHRRRTLKDISRLINERSLNESVKRNSIRIFDNLANAEAKVHNTLPEKVHFHGVGAIDSIIDIVGTVIAFHDLKINKIYFSPIRIGTGFVKCEHGQFPVPAPVTVELLKGNHVINTNIQRELTTPTEAAILTTLGVNVEMCPRDYTSTDRIWCGPS